LHENLPTADKLPWTISYVVRKRTQIDSFSELPKDKRPPDTMIWWGTTEEIDRWFERVFPKPQDKRTAPQDEFVLYVDESEIG
jgi:hypothetical protein